ncbi:MAG TPA: hypothetical protein VIK74_06360 [Parasegetibacter sp.]
MIRRDGTNISLWQQSIEPYSAANKVEKGIRYDVIIVGGGITGITTTLLLQEAGKK